MDKVSIIVAYAGPERVIGHNGEIPWHLPSDMRRFKAITTGHPVIMGRKTWESLPDQFRPLPNRTNIVMTQEAGYRAERAHVVSSVEAALEVARRAPGSNEVFVIGGEKIYRLFLPTVTRAYITEIRASIKGDAFFPEMNAREWMRDKSGSWPHDDRDQYPTSFRVFRRPEKNAAAD
jgi:dihydrofolate reductase